jgi:methyl-accepting chemotaxis protein
VASVLAELKKLVTKLDRRNHEFGRDGLPIDCATQLHSILKGCGSELDSSIRQAIACGQEIHRATEEIVIGSEAQSDSVEKTTSYIEQLTSRIITVCDGAEAALESSTKAKSTANKGLQQFQELVEEMKQIRNQAAARERKLQALGQHTKEIESIVQTIGTLSSRTDLLALNASIESVRAGENGRGFAIVAEEVRALAEQSAQAVMDITRRIEMIQLETHQSISVASGEHDQMHGAIKRVTDTLDSLQHIFDAASSSSLGLTEISNSTNQQLQLTREIIVALERSTETSRKNRSRAEGANWTAKTLGQISQQLENSLDMFRLSGAIETAEPDSNQPPIKNGSPSHHDLAPALSQ